MTEEIEKDFKDLCALSEKSGINELLELYDLFEENLRISETYLNELEPKFIFYTSSSTKPLKKREDDNLE
ncbi:MAG: hypothetical protein ACTSUL_02150 [Promethearchaeota archaeon]